MNGILRRRIQLYGVRLIFISAAQSKSRHIVGQSCHSNVDVAGSIRKSINLSPAGNSIGAVSNFLAHLCTFPFIPVWNMTELSFASHCLKLAKLSHLPFLTAGITAKHSTGRSHFVFNSAGCTFIQNLVKSLCPFIVFYMKTFFFLPLKIIIFKLAANAFHNFFIVK